MSRELLRFEIREGFDLLPRLKVCLIANRLGDELVVFNPETNRAHCLNGVAVSVWDACEKHLECIDAEQELHRRGDEDPGSTIESVLAQFDELGLIDRQAEAPDSIGRRALVKALVVGAITTIVVPTPAMAQSCIDPLDCVAGACLAYCCAPGGGASGNICGKFSADPVGTACSCLDPADDPNGNGVDCPCT